VGLAVFGAGAAIAVISVGTFVGKGKGTPAPFDAPREFVAAGPYRFVRNPMYIGGLLALLGFGLIMRSPSMALFAPLWSLFAHGFVVLYEEPVLRQKFGDTYRRYCERVPRWIPAPSH
jgi:protein-S-isoprenylcysteine O-methyltransferase Ste14